MVALAINYILISKLFEIISSKQNWADSYFEVIAMMPELYYSVIFWFFTF